MRLKQPAGDRVGTSARSGAPEWLHDHVLGLGQDLADGAPCGIVESFPAFVVDEHAPRLDTAASVTLAPRAQRVQCRPQGTPFAGQLVQIPAGVPGIRVTLQQASVD